MEPRVLKYDDRGSGPPIVMIPGGLTGWLSWIPHQDRLAAGYRVTRVQPIHNELGSAGVPGDPGYTAETEREALRVTLDALEMGRPHVAAWSGGAKAALEFATEYPDRVRSMVLVEPAAYWVLEQLGDRLEDVHRVNSFIHGLYGRTVTEDDLARFLELAGFVERAHDAPAHPNWQPWLAHRMALSWQSEQVDHPQHSVADLARIRCPVLLTKGTRTSNWLKRVVDVLGERLPNASVLEFDGDHAHHIQSIDAFLAALEAHIEAN